MGNMEWKIIGQRLAWEVDGIVQYPTASEIFDLCSAKTVEGTMYGALDALGIRFARIGGKIVLRTDFDERSKNIQLKVIARKGVNGIGLDYRGGDLPDSIIMDGVWYNLLSNHAETAKLLVKACIYEDGVIALGQYIKLSKPAESSLDVEFEDYAATALSNHPVNGESEKMPAALNAGLYP